LEELFSVNHARPPAPTAMSRSDGAYGASVAWIPLLVPGVTAGGLAKPTIPSFCTNHTRLFVRSYATLRTLLAQHDADSSGVGKVVIPLAVPGEAWEVSRRPSAGLGVDGFAGNQTVPSAAAVIPVLVL
jgi:hypothetical protein